jgi:hypothetical protein
MAAKYSGTFDQDMHELCEEAIRLIRDIQAEARAQATGREITDLPPFPFTDDVLMHPIFQGGRSQHILKELSTLFAHLQRGTLSHAFFLAGQSAVLPKAYSDMVREHGRYITLDDYRVTVAERAD